MNILIIGLGSIAQKHIMAIRQVLPEATIFALRSSDTAKTYPGIHNIFSLRDFTGKPDFVIISNPTQRHEETIRQSLKMGCPLFIEKPALSDLKNSYKILQEIQKKNILTYVACNMRFHPAVQFLKNYLSKLTVKINEVNIYCGSNLPGWRPGRDFRKTYSANANMGGGVHLDLIHELDYCVWLFGKPDSVTSIKRSVSSLTISAIDFAAYQLLYQSFVANITINYYRTDSKREIEIVTETESIGANLLTCSVINLTANRILFEESFNISSTYVQQMKYFSDHIKKNLQPMNGLEESVEVLKIALQR